MSATGKFMSWLQQKKDHSVSFVIEKLLAKKLAPYGQLLAFQLHSAENRASCRVLLRGETEPVTLSVDEYRLTQDATGTALTVVQACASREWLSQLLRDFLVGRSFPVPEQYASYARMLL
jgi:hypothetical protein